MYKRQIEGVVELAEEIFHKPVSLGMPRNVAGLADIVRNPIYATGVGLLLYGQELERRRLERGEAPPVMKGSFVDRIREWLRQNF